MMWRDSVRADDRGMAATAQAPETWFAQDEASVVAALKTDAIQGLTQTEAAARLTRDGPNEITGEKPPSVWQVAFWQVRQPKKIMPLVVHAGSFTSGEGA